MSDVRTYVVVGLDVIGMRWVPMFRCETEEKAQYIMEPILWLFGFVQCWSLICEIDDVEAVEAMCKGLPLPSMAVIFSAYADVADHAFTLGGGRFVRHLPKDTRLH